MKYFNGFHLYELTVFDVPLHYINAFITGPEPELGVLWVIFPVHMYICKHACTLNILTLHFITELLSTALMALNSFHKHRNREISVTTLWLQVSCKRYDYNHAYYTRPANR